MSDDRNRAEARRWLGQARHDRDAARLNAGQGFPEVACFLSQQSAEKARGLPGGIPHEFYTRKQADAALRDLSDVIALVERFVRI